MKVERHQKYLVPYATWSPTGADSPGLSLREVSERVPNPMVALTVTRDSGPLRESNFDAAFRAFEAADPSYEHFNDFTFDHWGCGWFKTLIFSGSHPGLVEAWLELAASLEDYPVIDEDELGERQEGRAAEIWEGLTLEERIEAIRKSCQLRREPVTVPRILAARRDEMPNIEYLELWPDSLY